MKYVLDSNLALKWVLRENKKGVMLRQADQEEKTHASSRATG
jgi:hypothetical protein